MLREKGLEYLVEHVDVLEQRLDLPGSDEPMVSLAMTDQVYLRVLEPVMDFAQR